MLKVLFYSFVALGLVVGPGIIQYNLSKEKSSQEKVSLQNSLQSNVTEVKIYRIAGDVYERRSRQKLDIYFLSKDINFMYLSAIDLVKTGGYSSTRARLYCYSQREISLFTRILCEADLSDFSYGNYIVQNIIYQNTTYYDGQASLTILENSMQIFNLTYAQLSPREYHKNESVTLGFSTDNLSPSDIQYMVIDNYDSGYNRIDLYCWDHRYNIVDCTGDFGNIRYSTYKIVYVVYNQQQINPIEDFYFTVRQEEKDFRLQNITGNFYTGAVSNITLIFNTPVDSRLDFCLFDFYGGFFTLSYDIARMSDNNRTMEITVYSYNITKGYYYFIYYYKGKMYNDSITVEVKEGSAKYDLVEMYHNLKSGRYNQNVFFSFYGGSAVYNMTGVHLYDGRYKYYTVQTSQCETINYTSNSSKFDVKCMIYALNVPSGSYRVTSYDIRNESYDVKENIIIVIQ